MDAPKDSAPFPAPASPVPPQHSWARPVMWMAVVLIVSVSGVIVFKSCRDLPGEALDKTGRVIDKAGRVISNVVAAFNHKSVTTAFLSYATTISNHQRLQVATLKQTEVFTQTNQSSTGFGYIPLPDVVVEARAPVEYTYYLDLSAPWKFDLKDGAILVAAPPLHFNKPAVDVSALNYEVRKGRFKTAEALEGLKRSITSLVRLRASENIPLVREGARRQTAEFIENWLMKNFSDAKQYPVKVYFPGEPVPGSLPVLNPIHLQTNEAVLPRRGD